MARRNRSFLKGLPGPDLRLGLMAVLIGIVALYVLYWLAWLVLRLPGRVEITPGREPMPSEAPALRGIIFDRELRPLVVNVFHYRLVAYADRLKDEGKDRDEKIGKVARVLGKDEAEVRACLQKFRKDSQGRVRPNFYCVLERDLDRGQKRSLEVKLANAFKDEGDELPPWLGFESFPVRYHVEGSLAAHVLGNYLPFSGTALGVELFYNRYLSGATTPPESRYAGKSEVPSVYAADGCSLVLTIDRDIQQAAEEVLAATVQAHGADGGVVVVVRPSTGEILAMAGYPSFEPDDISGFDRMELLKNPAVSALYEPGSVFKMVTYAAALDSGLITPQTYVHDEGLIVVGGSEIRNFQGARYGDVTATEALVHSINTIAAKLSVNMGENVFYEYVRRFGLDARTGVDLPGEARPLVKFPGDPNWSLSELGTNSFGQGVSVTPLHMAMVAAAIANDGLLMKPHVVSEVICGDRVYRLPEQNYRVRQVISPKTARDLKGMLQALAEYYPTFVEVPGYTVAGKTGTAQIPESGGYGEGNIASFAGFAPVGNPEVAILVKIDRPRGVPFTGLEVAAPAFKELVLRILPLLGVQPDKSVAFASGG